MVGRNLMRMAPAGKARWRCCCCCQWGRCCCCCCCQLLSLLVLCQAAIRYRYASNGGISADHHSVRTAITTSCGTVRVHLIDQVITGAGRGWK